MRVISLLIALSMFTPAMAAPTTPVKAAESFWKAFAEGDLLMLERLYASEVFLKKGSELLKTKWGVAKAGDRARGKRLKRADLMKAYKTMLDKLDKEKWKAVFGKIKKEQMSTKTLANKHLVLTVKAGPGDDYLEFEFALDETGKRWLVISEYSDF